MAENFVKYFTRDCICISPHQDELWSKAFFKARAGLGPKRAWPVVPEILSLVSIPLLLNLKHQTINLVLPNQMKACGDSLLRPRSDHLCQQPRAGERNYTREPVFHQPGWQVCCPSARIHSLFYNGQKLMSLDSTNTGSELFEILKFNGISKITCPVGLGCRIHRLLLCRRVRPLTYNECPRYDSKQSDDEVPVMLKF